MAHEGRFMLSRTRRHARMWEALQSLSKHGAPALGLSEGASASCGPPRRGSQDVLDCRRQAVARHLLERMTQSELAAQRSAGGDIV